MNATPNPRADLSDVETALLFFIELRGAFYYCSDGRWGVEPQGEGTFGTDVVLALERRGLVTVERFRGVPRAVRPVATH